MPTLYDLSRDVYCLEDLNERFGSYEATLAETRRLISWTLGLLGQRIVHLREGGDGERGATEAVDLCVRCYRKKRKQGLLE